MRISNFDNVVFSEEDKKLFTKGVENLKYNQMSLAGWIALIFSFSVLAKLPVSLCFIGFSCLIASIVWLIYIHAKYGKYKHKGYTYQKSVVKPMLERLAPNIHVEPKIETDPVIFPDAMNKSVPYQMYKARLVPIKDACYNKGLAIDYCDGQDGFQAYRIKLDVMRDKHYRVYFNGTLLHLKLKKNYPGYMYIMSTYSKKGVLGDEREVVNFDKLHKGEEKVDIESEEFNSKFEVYATDPVQAFRYLNSSVVERLIELRKQYKFCCYINENDIWISIYDFLMFDEPSMYGREVNDYTFNEALTDLKNTMDLVYNLIDAITEGK